MSTITKEMLEKLSRDLTDQGKLIEAGWIGLRIAVVPPEAPQVQLDEMRTAFFAGAQHLFASIMSILDPGVEPTDKDIERMTMIDAELRAFVEAFKKKHGLGFGGMQ
ncbi:MAG: hypothetical protein NUV75_02130 [Gallionella sp.]|nr:hypothetical protein [Gallionella sp.]